ncbi:MAG: Fic family protein [Acidobacteria bacterium]|nr:Fic family protein [Acidobacteriota bacterium]
MLGECHSKCEHLAGVPLRPDIAEILHSVYLAKGAWGTTAIEGNTLTEAEVLRHVQGKGLDVPPEKAEDCEVLVSFLCDWLNGPDFGAQGGFAESHLAILKAMLGHLYIEWIHPFGDGNGRTGRLVEEQLLLAAGVTAPACHLLSNHYNQTRREYLRQLSAASESGGDVLPFLTYALSGFLEGLKGQLAYIRRLHVETTWVNFVHDYFRNQSSKAAHRQKNLLLDLAEKGEAVQIGELDQLSPRLAKAYANLHPRTGSRDVETLLARKLVVRDGRSIRANLDLISHFLPIKATTKPGDVPPITS